MKISWNKIEDELPETKTGIHAKIYFVASITKDWKEIGVAKYSKKRGWYDKSEDVYGTNITHWMQPPKF